MTVCQNFVGQREYYYLAGANIANSRRTRWRHAQLGNRKEDGNNEDSPSSRTSLMFRNRHMARWKIAYLHFAYLWISCHLAPMTQAHFKVTGKAGPSILRHHSHPTLLLIKSCSQSGLSSHTLSFNPLPTIDSPFERQPLTKHVSFRGSFKRCFIRISPELPRSTFDFYMPINFPTKLNTDNLNSS